eukprot:289901_1
MQNELTLNSPEFLMQKISFANPKNNGQSYRSIGSSSSASLHHTVSAPAPFIKSHTNHAQPQSQSLSLLDFPVHITCPQSKALAQPLQPLDISFASMGSDIEEDEVSMSCISPVVPPPSLANASASSFKYCNEVNSYLVDNSDCLQVMNTLSDILSHYRADIDFKIDYAQKRIDGLVFVSNYCVHFMLYIWQETQNNTRIEFRRSSGDALASAKFWSQIQSLYRQDTSKPMDIDYDAFDFIALDAALGTAQNKRWSKAQLDELTQCVIQNDVFVVDELNYVYESMLANKDIGRDLLSHHELMHELINSALLNQDVCVTRTVLLILQELAKIKGNEMGESGFKLFENLNVLLTHQRAFIRRYCIELLYHVSNEMESWCHVDEICRQRMMDNVSKCKNDSMQQMIHKINEKLMMK